MNLFGFNIGSKAPETVTMVPTKEGYQSFDAFAANDNQNGLNSYLEVYQGAKWVYFGKDNKYPNYLNTLYNSSGLHSAIIDFKNNLICGAGFELEGIDTLGINEQINIKQFFNFIDGIKGVNEMIVETVQDYLIHGTIYFKVYWNSDKTRVLKLKRIEPSKLRLGVKKTDMETVDKYYYCFDWNLYGQYPITEIAPFTPEKNNDRVEIFRFIVPNSGVNFYTLPTYAAGVNWIALDGQVANFHKNNIENSINPSLMISFYQKPATPEDKRTILKDIQKSYGGTNNAGKAMVFFSDGKELAPEIKPIDVSQLDEQFNVTADAIQRNICYAAKINPMIMGLKTPGSLGNSSELDTAFEIFSKSVIEPAQKDIERVINKFVKLNGLNVLFKLNEMELYTPKI
jgi:hypothetical protein